MYLILSLFAFLLFMPAFLLAAWILSLLTGIGFWAALMIVTALYLVVYTIGSFLRRRK